MRRILCILFVSIFIVSACSRNTGATAPPLPKKTSIPTPTTTPVSGNECLNCHVDQQQLIDTARPEEVVVKESSGAG